jgi:hypothetical protein
MNLKLRLERLCDFRAWVKLHFADGTNLVGRVVRLGHDYVELESYGDPTKSTAPDYSKHLIPLGLLKYITIESPAFAQAERKRLDYLSTLDTEANPEGLPELEK